MINISPKPLLSIKRARIFCDGLDHPECIALHPNGEWFAGGEAGQIYRIDAKGKTITEIARSGGFILGIRISSDGKILYACDLKKKCVWMLNLNACKSSLRPLPGSLKLNLQIPNHLCFLGGRTLLVTDSGSSQKPTGRILWFDLLDHNKFGIWHPGPFAFANGIGYDQVNSLVRVVCSHLPGVETIQVDAQMKAGRKLAKIQIPKTVPDGIAILQNGTMLLPCYTPNRIYQISREGRIRVLMDDWFGHTLSNPTNVVLFGKNQNRLMAANFGRWHLTEIKLAP